MALDTARYYASLSRRLTSDDEAGLRVVRAVRAVRRRLDEQLDEVAHLLHASRACAEGTQDLEVEVRLQWLAVDAPDVSGMTDDEVRDAYWQRLATGEGVQVELNPRGLQPTAEHSAEHSAERLNGI